MKLFAEWLAANEPPNLQALAAQYGGLSDVPAEVWLQFWRELEGWRERQRRRHEDG